MSKNEKAPQTPKSEPVQLAEVLAAADLTKPNSDAAAESAPAAPARRAFVRAVYGDMVNVLTAERITETPKKVDIDHWVQAQLDAGKLVEGEPE